MLSNFKEEFTLDINTIKEISYENYEKDFTFIVNKKKYCTPRIVADILSPKIRQYYLIDRTFDTFRIDIPVCSSCDFSSVLSLASFKTEQFSQDELKYFRNIFFLLGNKKEFIKLTPKYKEEVSIENVFDRINIIENYTKLLNQNEKYNKNDYKCNVEEITVGNDLIRQEIDFVASHFSEIDASKIKKLNPSIIEDIISNAKLQVTDEDTLLRFIMDLYSNNHKLAYLFDNVNFLNVSQKVFQNFSSIFQYEDVNPYIWNSIIERTARSKLESIPEAINSKAYRQEDKEISIPYVKNKEFKGIIKHLTDDETGNNDIEVYSNLVTPGKDPRNLLDYDFRNNLYYEATNSKDYAWVCFDFQSNLVKITNYTIKSANCAKDGYHLRSWELETSDDENSWTQIDKCENCLALNGKSIVASFKVKNNSDYARYVRIRQTDQPWGGGHLWFRAIEFYGFIKHL